MMTRETIEKWTVDERRELVIEMARTQAKLMLTEKNIDETSCTWNHGRFAMLNMLAIELEVYEVRDEIVAISTEASRKYREKMDMNKLRKEEKLSLARVEATDIFNN